MTWFKDVREYLYILFVFGKQETVVLIDDLRMTASVKIQNWIMFYSVNQESIEHFYLTLTC